MAQTPVVDTIELLGFGIFSYKNPVQKEDRSSTGLPLTTGEAVRIDTRTDHIRIKDGVAFGIEFVPRGRPAGATVTLRAFTYAKDGICRKSSGETVFESERRLQKTLGRTTYYGWMSRPDDECKDLPGLRTVEIYEGDRKLLEKSFTLTE